MSMECFSIYLCPLLFPLAMVCSSPWRGPLHPLLAVFLGIEMLVISAHWFLYPESLLKLLINLRRFWAARMESSKYTIMSSANRDNLTSSSHTSIPFISFSCLIALSRTSNTILNRSGLVPDVKGNASSFAHSVWYWLRVFCKQLLLVWDRIHRCLVYWEFVA